MYTAGVVLPHPISSCRYYHRSLNPKKLIEVKFSHKHPKLTYKVGVFCLFCAFFTEVRVRV